MKKLLCILVVLCISLVANSYTLQWSDYSVPAGTTNYTYTNVDGSGIDINVNWFSNSNMLAGYPTLDVATLGITSGHWFANTNTGSTVVFVSFSEAIPYLKVNFSEIDGLMTGTASPTNYIDKIRIKGWDKDYAGWNAGTATAIAASGYDGGEDIVFVEVPLNAALDSGLNIINGGLVDIFDNEAANRAWVTYEDNALKGFAFQFSSTGAERGAVMADLVFVPEPMTMVLVGLGAVLGLKRRS